MIDNNRLNHSLAVARKMVEIEKLYNLSQLSKVYSKYWWNNKLEECDEYKLNFRTKKKNSRFCKRKDISFFVESYQH